jgi:hypothetical protein
MIAFSTAAVDIRENFERYHVIYSIRFPVFIVAEVVVQVMQGVVLGYDSNPCFLLF